jgi:acetyl-CoA acetyltransferase
MPDLVVTGVAEARIDPESPPTLDDLICATARAAVLDAGLDRDAIDGVITTVPRADPLTWHGSAVAVSLGLAPRFVLSIPQGGAAALMTLYQAAAAIEAGLATRVLIVGIDLLRSGLGSSGAVAAMADTGYRTFERPYGPSVPSAFALLAQRHMHEFGTTSEALATVAVAMRANASAHPNAQARGALDVDQVLQSRMIASPLHLFDCSLVSDGGAALVVEARSSDPKAVRVLGWAEAHNPEWVTEMPSLAGLRCSAASAAAAYELAAVGPADVDLALIYDPFTISTVVALEDLGFCDVGEGGPLVESGAIAPTGSIPVNPHGGLLSHSHPGRPAALIHLVEAVRQLRGDALGIQIPDVEVAVATAEGAMLGSYATVVLGR